VVYKDDLATAQLRLLANAPQLASTGRALSLALLQPFLGRMQDLEQLITVKEAGRDINTAVGSDLDLRGQSVGVSRPPGAPATIPVVGGAGLIFSTDAPVTSPLVIPAGTIVSTAGNGTTTTPLGFVTTAAAIISTGQTTAPPVGATAGTTAAGLSSGSAGNVTVGTVTVVVSTSGVHVTNTVAGQGGMDQADDPTYRTLILSALASKYGKVAVQLAITSIPGVYDAYVYDPQDGLGTIPYIWSDINGNTPGLTGATPGSLTVSGTVGAGTLAATVDSGVLGVLPPRNTAIRSSFSVTNLTIINVSYTVAPTISSTVIAPQIQAAIIAYVQGLRHGQAPDKFAMYLAVQQAVGFVLTSWSLNSTTPTIPAGTPAQTVLYRAINGPATVTFT